jgi:hypothetical protein
MEAPTKVEWSALTESEAAHSVLAAMVVLVVAGVAISQSFIGHWIARIVAPPGRGWIGLGGLIYLQAVALLMAVVLVAVWMVGRWAGGRDR